MRKVWMGHVRRLILNRDEGRCIYCGVEAAGIDHVIPISEGGLTIPANGVCCCKSCNSRKGAKLDESWIVRGLQRLIQHGENIHWIAGIRYNTADTDHKQKAISILLDGNLDIPEIATSMGLSFNEVLRYARLIKENERSE